MRTFSIRQLENFSGVKAHTIRVWEKRYRIFQPHRSKGNTRYYLLNDVRHLLNIALLIKNGAKISKLAGIDAAAIHQKVKSLTTLDSSRNKLLNQLIVCMVSNDIEQFEDLLDSCILSWDVDITIKELILPFLEKVELLSYRDTSCEAHFAITAIRRKIILGLERVDPSASINKAALLFLSKGEHYDLMLLYMSYILKKNGVRVLYLGTNISEDILQSILLSKKPDLLYTYIPQKQKFKMGDLVHFLNQHLPQTKFFAVGCEKHETRNDNLDNLNFIHYKEIALFLRQ